MKKVLLVMLVVSLSLAPAFAESGLSDPKELESFLDGIMAAHLQDHHIPGATLSVVKDGKLFFSKGYGYADIDKRVPVDPDQTLFRPGSVSKLFTWTAVMQMVEQGKLDLNADINQYLTYFKIPNTFPQPITTVHLLTHAPGFEDSALAMGVKKYEDIPAVRDFLKNRIPARVIPPGKLSAYSNYGCTLGGYLVEVLSGTPFNRHVEKNIFKPLGMNNTTFDQKQTPAVIKNMSKGYQYADGRYKAEDYEFIAVQAAGSAMTTANDMARFMIAHLQNGKLGDARILKEETAKLMHANHFGFDPRLDQMCYGFYELTVNGHRLIGHEGDTGVFHTLLMISSQDNFGLFISYNAPGGSAARRELLQALMDHYYPRPLPPVRPQDIQKQAGQIVGTYVMNRRAFTTFEKIIQLFGGTLKLSVQEDNTVLVKTGNRINDLRIARIGPDIYTALYGKNRQLLKLVDGRMVFSINLPFLVFEKLAWYETPRLHQIAGGACLLVFLAALIGWPVNWLRKRHFSFPHLLSGLIALLFVITLPLIIAHLQSAVGKPAALIPWLLIPLVGSLLSIGAVIYTVLAWKQKYWTLWERIRYSIVTAAMLVFIVWLNYWNLLGFKF
jgi:CubicO group peptidase (beta-lactamase class C family)